MTGCMAGSSGEEADQEKELLSTRGRVIDELTSLLTDLTAAVPARLRFTQGNYDTCTSDLKGPTGYTYNVNGRLDLDAVGSAADLDTVAAALEDAGYTTQRVNEVTVEGKREGLVFEASVVAGEPAVLFSSGSDACYEIGGDRAKDYNVDQDPITLD